MHVYFQSLVLAYGVVLMADPCLMVESVSHNWDHRELAGWMSVSPVLVQTSLEKLGQMIEVRFYRLEGRLACLPQRLPYGLG